MYTLKSEYEVERGYIDLALFPEDTISDLDIILFELKYIKKKDTKKKVGESSKAVTEKAIADAISGATEHLQKYRSAQEFSGEKIICWAIVFVGLECVYREKVEAE